MLQLTVTRPFRGVPDGQLRAREYHVGDLVEGRLAQIALDNGWAARALEEKKKAPRNKADAPERAKRGSASRPDPA